jgi:hypothetical protein
VNALASSPWRAGWSGRIFAQPRWITVTFVPLGAAAKSTSTSVSSSGRKFAVLHRKTTGLGGSHAVTTPF